MVKTDGYVTDFFVIDPFKFLVPPERVTHVPQAADLQDES